MEKFFLRLAIIILSLFGLSVFGWLVKHNSTGDKILGDKVGKGLDAYVSFLDLF